MSIDATLNERQKTHGDFASHAVLSQTMKSIMQAQPKWSGMEDDQHEALEMIVHKIARILNGDPHYPDHWRDIAGYATLVERRLSGD